MTTRTQTATLDALRQTIARIERRPSLKDTTTNSENVAGALPVPSGVMHEVFTDATRNGGATLGFALAQARHLLTPQRPALIYIHLLRDSQEFGLPYAAGLARFGFSPEEVLLARTATITELLWAAEEALACQAVAAVIAEIRGAPKQFDFTASRRLSMRAASAGASLFVMRYGTGREASAAGFRWHLTPERSAAMPFDAKAPGAPRWLARLEKGVLDGRVNGQWLLEWREHGLLECVSPFGGAAEHAAADRRSTLHGSEPAALGDGLSQTG
ncbi:hypothetical protein GCM10007989_19590 [Devosia pacifica]|uniref:Protein ImuA n=1 Tax=Devosia pacifica TaxID=1335967 RepID=A0A918VTI8_9HYPH|nr:hypothetical protein GCM10007989_19590 [Devosia pacifica]